MSRAIKVERKPRIVPYYGGGWQCMGLRLQRAAFVFKEWQPDFGYGETPLAAYLAWCRRPGRQQTPLSVAFPGLA